jgi:hypothetical protein
MSYAGSITDAYRLADVYTDRILKGEKAELFINLKNAKTFRYHCPAVDPGPADEVIQ